MTGAPSKRCAIYARVSKSDGSQSTDNQKPDLEQLALVRGLEIVSVYEEAQSAAKNRPEYDRMMTDAKRGRFGVLLVWAVDWLGRSMVGNLQDVLELDRIGVTVVSVRETWLDTGGPVRNLLLAIFSWVAEQERARLIERTIAGQERARRQGRRIGRVPAEKRVPGLHKGVRLDVDRARALLAAGKSQRAAAKELGVGEGTLRRALARASASETLCSDRPDDGRNVS